MEIKTDIGYQSSVSFRFPYLIRLQVHSTKALLLFSNRQLAKAQTATLWPIVVGSPSQVTRNTSNLTLTTCLNRFGGAHFFLFLNTSETPPGYLCQRGFLSMFWKIYKTIILKAILAQSVERGDNGPCNVQHFSEKCSTFLLNIFKFDIEMLKSKNKNVETEIRKC